jgi:hypothetical protein
MFVIAIAFITSTAGMLIATALEALRRRFGHRFGGRA